jgi:uncharacterized NAD-dependent epimerase/dehydratase family protein
MIAAPYLLYLGETPVPEMAKTAIGLAHWRPERCLGQWREQGATVDLGLPEMDAAEAAARGARTLVIGTALPGGKLPPHWIARLVDAMAAGLDIASGLHLPLSAVPELKAAALRTGRTLHDVRLTGQAFPIGHGTPRSGHRLLTMGTDCAIGKKYTALAIHRELTARGVDATFRATGQTGVLIDGHGFAVDAIVCDFLAGAVETLSPSAAPDHWDIIEGQGSLYHPAYAGVTLGLLHGSQPDHFIVCHEAGRSHLLGFADHRVGDIAALIDLTVTLGRIVSPAIRCSGISLNTARLDEKSARAEMDRLSAQHNLPVCDPVRFDVTAIVDRLIEQPDF